MGYFDLDSIPIYRVYTISMGNPDRKSYTAGQLAKVVNVNRDSVASSVAGPVSRSEL